MYMGHSLENPVGVTQSSTWNEAESAVEGIIKFYSNAPGTSIAVVNCVDASSDELLSEPSPPDIALSMVFYPQWEQNPPSPQVNAVEPRDGAGGEGLRCITPTACSKNLR